MFESGVFDSMGLLFLIEFINDTYQLEVGDEDLNPKNFESIKKNIICAIFYKVLVNLNTFSKMEPKNLKEARIQKKKVISKVTNNIK